MNTLYLKQIREMLAGVEKFIYDDSIEVRQVASYIMGQVMFHDDYDMLIDFCQELEVLAEQGSDLEMMNDDSPYLTLMIAKARATFELIKFKVNESRLEKKRRWSGICILVLMELPLLLKIRLSLRLFGRCRFRNY